MFLPRRDSPDPPMHSRPRMCSFDDALLPGYGGSAELWRESAILHTGTVRLLSRAERQGGHGALLEVEHMSNVKHDGPTSLE